MTCRMASLLWLPALALGLLLSTAPALAGIVSVDAVPSRIAISATAPSTVTVVWRVVRIPGTVVPNPGVVSSPSGQFLLNGAVVGTVNRTLSRSLPGATIANEGATFSETFTVPRALAFRAVKSGAALVLRRTFTDNTGAVAPFPASLSGDLILNPSGPGSESFTVSRLSLTFDDDSRVRVLPKGSRLRARAELNTTGSGLIIAQWEIAPATTTAGAPVFRPLSLVRQNIAGGRRVVITSPPLPTRFEGSNIVRLSITEPGTVFDAPELQYYVTPESPLPEGQQPRLLLTTSPGPGTPLTQTTRFAWQAIPGATAYKLEFFRGGSGPAEPADQETVVSNAPLGPAPTGQPEAPAAPLTGIVVPAAVTETRLKDFTLAHLPSDRRYRWLVKAIGENGVTIGVSALADIYKP